jgi:hypothetical protein
MSKSSLSAKEVSKIKDLRKTGHTLSEIKALTKRSNGTIWKYIENVSVLPKYQEIWKAKRGGSKAKSASEWKEAQIKASSIINHIGLPEKMLILSCLYWGEGNKTELNLINSDPEMLRVIVSCFKDLGIQNSELKISLRLFQDINKEKAISFWTHSLKLPKGSVSRIELIHGNKVGKLKYGMCRIRVTKGGKYFKLMISMINFIKSNV